MSDEEKKTPPVEEEEDAGIGDEDAPALKALLKRSLALPGEEPAKAEAPAAAAPTEADKALLAAVQKKLRQRSKGKFYADGWSTTQSKVSYALVAIVMLVTILAVYLAMGPTGIH